MDTLFLGHGSPKTAFTENKFSRKWKELGSLLPLPKNILIISAHWVTDGSFVSSAENPETIHDFFGFIDEYSQFLYEVEGAPQLAKRISDSIPEIDLDDKRGLDHGAWCILKNMYPEARIPCFQLSLDMNLDLEGHVELAKKLRHELPEGTLVIGSGNVVHNLSRIAYDEKESSCWADKFEKEVKAALIKQDLKKLLELPFDSLVGGPMSVPTLEHYIPLLYTFGCGGEISEFLNEGIIHNSLSMLSYIGKREEGDDNV